MNDDELGQILRADLHRRFNPPDVAPEAVHDHLRELRSVAPVRRLATRPTPFLRELFGVAAVVAICSLVAVGLLIRPGNEPGPGFGPRNGIEMFGRIDSQTAWAESGSDLWITRDGGATWSKGTVPGGKSPWQLYDTTASSAPDTDSEPAGATEGPAAPPATDTPAPDRTTPFHFYPNFVDAEHGWLLSWKPSPTADGGADYSMTLWRTTDGAATWTATPLAGTYRGFGVVQFVDASHGWITILRQDVGRQQEVIVDGVATTPTPEAPATLPGDATIILATSDGGATWSRVSTSNRLMLPHWISDTEAWAFGSTQSGGSLDTIAHSTDGGRTWQPADLAMPGDSGALGWPTGPSARGGKLVVSAAHGTNAGTDVVNFASSDGGLTWTYEGARSAFSGWAGLTNNQWILNLTATQPIAGFDGSDQNAGFKATFDGGSTWESYSIAGLPTTNVTVAEWAAPGDAWALVMPAGAPAYTTGQLYSTRDGGKTWKPLLGAQAWPASARPETPVPIETPQPSDSAPPQSSGGVSGTFIHSVGRAGARTGWVVTGGDLLQLRITDDGGATWSEPRPLPNAEELQFVDAEHGWIASVAAANGYFGITVNRTVDGGVSWQARTIATRAAVGDQVMYTTAAVHFRDATHGELFFASGPAGPPDPAPTTLPGETWTCSRYTTADGGATWSDPVAGPCLGDVTFEDADFGYAADARMMPILYVTTDGGQTWTTGSLPEDSTITSTTAVHLVVRRADGKLRAIGDWAPNSAAPIVVESSDGGRTWKTLGAARGRPEIIDQVVALSDDHWLAIGANPSGAVTGESLYSSQDGGLTWQKAGIGDATAQPFRLAFASETDGWVVMTSLVCAGPATPKPAGCGADASSLYATSDGGQTWTPFFAP